MSEPTETKWFTFGQDHLHHIDGMTFDRDCVVKITAVDARQKMFDTFGRKWAMQYDQEPDMDYFPRGVFEL